AICAEVPGIRHAIIVGDASKHTPLDSFAPNPASLPDEDVDPSNVALVQISGGSTGLSKLIPRTHNDYLYSIRASNPICGVTADSVYMAALPVAHNFPMSSPGVFGALMAGATVVM